MTTPQQLTIWIREGLPCDHLEVDGDDRHFSVLVVSAKFNGLERAAQHQLVHRVLSGRMHDDKGVLSLRTLTPQEWRAGNG